MLLSFEQNDSYFWRQNFENQLLQIFEMDGLEASRRGRLATASADSSNQLKTITETCEVDLGDKSVVRSSVRRGLSSSAKRRISVAQDAMADVSISSNIQDQLNTGIIRENTMLEVTNAGSEENRLEVSNKACAQHLCDMTNSNTIQDQLNTGIIRENTMLEVSNVGREGNRLDNLNQQGQGTSGHSFLSYISPRSLVSPGNCSKNSSGLFCRICHEGDGLERLLSPCQCSGSVALVHKSCIEKWLSTVNNDTCELCRHKYSVAKQPKPFTEWLCSTSVQDDQRNLVGDLICFFLLTPLAGISTYLCATGAIFYYDEKRSEAMGLISLCTVLVIIYLVWVFLTIKYHIQVWFNWRETNQEIHLLDVGRNPVQPSRWRSFRRHSKQQQNQRTRTSPADVETTAQQQQIVQLDRSPRCKLEFKQLPRVVPQHHLPALQGCHKTTDNGSQGSHDVEEAAYLNAKVGGVKLGNCHDAVANLSLDNITTEAQDKDEQGLPVVDLDITDSSFYVEAERTPSHQSRTPRSARSELRSQQANLDSSYTLPSNLMKTPRPQGRQQPATSPGTLPVPYPQSLMMTPKPSAVGAPSEASTGRTRL